MKYVHSVLCQIVGDTVPMCGTYMHINCLYVLIKCICHMCNLISIFDPVTCMEETCEVDVVFHCVLEHVCTTDLYAHTEWGQCDPWFHTTDASGLCMAHKCPYIPLNTPERYAINGMGVKCDGHICFWFNTMYNFRNSLERRETKEVVSW